MDDKILKNTTLSDITLDSVGIVVPASSQYNIDKIQYSLFSTDSAILELTTYINSGDIVVNNGTDDLDSTNGLNYMRMSDHAKNILFDDSTSLNTMVGVNLQDVINDISTPDVSSKPTYNINGELDYIEFFKSATQTTINRRGKATITYDVNLDPATETWELYDVDGTTVLKTVIVTYTFVNSIFTKSERATS